MKLWLDDQIDDPEAPDRHVPDGWVGVKTPKEAIRFIKTGKVLEISFDHDLGERWWGNGYTVARFIEREAFFGKLRPISFSIHSANPVGAQNILMSMRRASQFWDEKALQKGNRNEKENVYSVGHECHARSGRRGNP